MWQMSLRTPDILSTFWEGLGTRLSPVHNQVQSRVQSPTFTTTSGNIAHPSLTPPRVWMRPALTIYGSSRPQLSSISIRTCARVQVGRPSKRHAAIWLARSNNSVEIRKAQNRDRFYAGFSSLSRDWNCYCAWAISMNLDHGPWLWDSHTTIHASMLIQFMTTSTSNEYVL